MSFLFYFLLFVFSQIIPNVARESHKIMSLRLPHSLVITEHNRVVLIRRSPPFFFFSSWVVLFGNQDVGANGFFLSCFSRQQLNFVFSIFHLSRHLPSRGTISLEKEFLESEEQFTCCRMTSVAVKATVYRA